MITINGKNYDEKKFAPQLANYIASRNEMQINKARLLLDIEKIDVLTLNFDGKIQKLLENETPLETPDGKDS